jgi:hypothetical protein
MAVERSVTRRLIPVARWGSRSEATMSKTTEPTSQAIPVCIGDAMDLETCGRTDLPVGWRRGRAPTFVLRPAPRRGRRPGRRH